MCFSRLRDKAQIMPEGITRTDPLEQAPKEGLRVCLQGLSNQCHYLNECDAYAHKYPRFPKLDFSHSVPPPWSPALSSRESPGFGYVVPYCQSGGEDAMISQCL